MLNLGFSVARPVSAPDGAAELLEIARDVKVGAIDSDRLHLGRDQIIDYNQRLIVGSIALLDAGKPVRSGNKTQGIFIGPVLDGGGTVVAELQNATSVHYDPEWVHSLQPHLPQNQRFGIRVGIATELPIVREGEDLAAEVDPGFARIRRPNEGNYSSLGYIAAVPLLDILPGAPENTLSTLWQGHGRFDDKNSVLLALSSRLQAYSRALDIVRLSAQDGHLNPHISPDNQGPLTTHFDG